MTCTVQYNYFSYALELINKLFSFAAQLVSMSGIQQDTYEKQLENLTLGLSIASLIAVVWLFFLKICKLKQFRHICMLKQVLGNSMLASIHSILAHKHASLVWGREPQQEYLKTVHACMHAFLAHMHA